MLKKCLLFIMQLQYDTQPEIDREEAQRGYGQNRRHEMSRKAKQRAARQSDRVAFGFGKKDS